MACSLSSWHLVCPHDRKTLIGGGTAWSCPSCGRRYPVRDGVISFVERDDPFYEGAYNNQVKYLPRGSSFLATLPLWLISSGYVWTVKKQVQPSARVVELGCAGGVAWFGRNYDMAGVDLSRESLSLAAKNYRVCLQADSMRLPLTDGDVDAVISSYFWEHIAPQDKPVLLEEVVRVLKPGGVVVFLYDVATDNPLISLLRRRDPKRYVASFIDCDGHLGYQAADENDALFQAHGLRILRSFPMERSFVQSLSTYDKMAGWPGMVGRIGRWLGFLHRRGVFYPYQALLRLVDETVGRLLPRRWGRIAMMVAVKK